MLEGLWALTASESKSQQSRIEELQEQVDELRSEQDEALVTACNESYEKGRDSRLEELVDMLALARLADPAGFDYLARKIGLPDEIVERAVGYQKIGAR